MRFTKMQGAGNDYVYVDVTEEPLENPSEIALKISDRHFGIGADGLILIGRSETADFRMTIYNADGSLAAMCGNGIRCVGKYVYDHGLTDKTEISVESDSGIKYLTLFPENGKVRKVRVNMGCPSFVPSSIPVDVTKLASEVPADAAELIDVPISVSRYLYNMTPVSMGNPHAVVFTDHEPREKDVAEVGSAFENHPAFPDRVNAEFVYILDRHSIFMRVWERGAGETFACGTGACASSAAGIKRGLLDSPVSVKLLGGDLEIEWAGEGRPVYMTGPAETVFEGDIDLNSL